MSACRPDDDYDDRVVWDEVPDLVGDGGRPKNAPSVASDGGQRQEFTEHCPSCDVSVYRNTASGYRRMVPLGNYVLSRPCLDPRETSTVMWSVVSMCARLGSYPAKRGVAWQCTDCHVFIASANSAAVLAAAAAEGVTADVRSQGSLNVPPSVASVMPDHGTADKPARDQSGTRLRVKALNLSGAVKAD